jgi:pimeloyl-ACP methyl ester carboxylesterase
MSLELHAETTGQGAPVLLLHGLFGSATNWRSIARALGDRHAVHALDLRNHGASPWADTMDYREMADDVRAFLDRHGIDQAAVLGHSMGGKVAMALALTQPERVRCLIVADIAPVAYADSLSPFADAMRGIDLMSAASRTDIQRQLQSLLPDPSVAPFLAQNLVSRNEHFDWRINLGAISASVQELAGFPDELRARRYERPVAVIAGAASNYVRERDASEFAPMFPNATVEFIQNAGHWVHADQPRIFVERVRAALDA